MCGGGGGVGGGVQITSVALKIHPRLLPVASAARTFVVVVNVAVYVMFILTSPPLPFA